MSDQRIVVIDADSILYAIASTAEMCAKKQGLDGEDLWFPVKPPDQCYQEVLEKIDERIDQVEASDAIVVLSASRNFRYDILPSYKSNRAATRRPPMLVHLREAIQERKPFPVMSIVNLEADDVCGIVSTSMQVAYLKGKADKIPVVSSDDKDMLSIPGLLHIPRKNQVVSVTVEEADRAHLYQTLIGDYVDGYTGLPGCGPKTADKILDGADSASVGHMYRAVEAAYVARGHTPEDCLTQARVARILRNTDWDHSTREHKLWTPPKV